MIKKLSKALVVSAGVLASGFNVESVNAESVESAKISAIDKLIRINNASERRHAFALVYGNTDDIDKIKRLLSNHESKMYKPDQREKARVQRIQLFQKFVQRKWNTAYGLFVNADEQRLYLVKKQKKRVRILFGYKVSTSKKVSGNIPDSNRTPVGIHTIKSKYKGVFGEIVSVEPVPIRLYKKVGEKKMVRSLLSTGKSLSGKKNTDKEHAAVITARLTIDPKRGIHIHGTNRVDLLGHRGSSGCIRMSNVDIVHIYGLVKTGSMVAIHDSRTKHYYNKPRVRARKKIETQRKPYNWDFDFDYEFKGGHYPKAERAREKYDWNAW